MRARNYLPRYNSVTNFAIRLRRNQINFWSTQLKSHRNSKSVASSSLKFSRRPPPLRFTLFDTRQDLIHIHITDRGEKNLKEMTSRLHIQGDESVLLRVTHSNIKSFSADIHLSLKMTVEGVKEKLWKKCGTSVNSMSLELYDDCGSKISDLSNNAISLGFYSPLDGYRLHVIDLDPSSLTSGGWLEDTSLVEKYTISDEAYNKLDGTFKKYKEKISHPSARESKISDNYMQDQCANIKIGDRCQVEPGEKRGVIKFVGRAEALGPGFWVGIQYDEPLGKHDGMVKGTRYFNCSALHGAMVRPDKVKVGDYPERDPFEDEEI